MLIVLGEIERKRPHGRISHRCSDQVTVTIGLPNSERNDVSVTTAENRSFDKPIIESCSMDYSLLIKYIYDSSVQKCSITFA